MEKFTKELCELYVEKDIPLIESLRIMKNRPNGKNRCVSEYILDHLEQGELFSNILQKCPVNHFDAVYVTFVSVAEKTENLQNIIKYLNQKCERYRENVNKLVTALIYPIFVILLTFFICIFLKFYLGIDRNNELYKYFVFFLFGSGLLIGMILKTLSVNKLYEAFLGTDLLVKNGVPISSAVSYGALIAGTDSKVGKSFISAAEKLEYGMTLESSFCFKNEFQSAFFLADISGGKKDVFGKIANWIAEKDKKKRIICLQLIEPTFISMTGLFLIMIILDFFVPILNNINFV